MEITAKLMALDIAALALLSEHANDVKFWERIERFTAEIIHDPAVSDALADKIQTYLDSWREAAGPEADRPAAP
ncbi:hypothetical protein [Thiobacillus sp.]|uniref:hypothetical protein n=1 Tax=Thiobacillus sp. TaxID=924 RepID=UPI0017C4717A|nr:hypothetical protein [Thiobacillus sp.]MBC2731363.1 hypothetical protein [Thiobacillus sp.]MBC2740100.1 hypothetical protein [Thiobacillus sp.]MBC2758312.1 hypothetical protein [Thiobacillus sp.]